MGRFSLPKAKADPRNEWGAEVRRLLPDWLEENCPPEASGATAGNGAIDIIVGAHKVASFLPTSTGLSVYLIGSTDTEVKRIERLCERAGVPEDVRPPRTSKYVLIKVKARETLPSVAEALRLHCLGKG